MPDRHVHWPDELAGENDNTLFVPSPSHVPSLSLTTDDSDSIHDSSPPSTPPSGSIYSSRTLDDRHFQRHVQTTPISVREPAFPHITAQFPLVRILDTSPDAPRWSFEDSPSASDSHQQAGPPQSLPPLSQSPRKYPFPSQAHPRERSASPTLHPFLAFMNVSPFSLMIWDLRDEPSVSSVRTTMANSSTSDVLRLLLAPATDPARREMHIHCVGNSVYEPLIVRSSAQSDVRRRGTESSGVASSLVSRASESSNTVDYITVLQVLRGIHHYLQTLVSASEFSELRSLPTPGLQNSVAEAFHKRRADTECRKAFRRSASGRNPVYSHHSPSRQVHQTNFPTSPSSIYLGANTSAYSENSDQKESLKRLDLLLGQTRFLGLAHLENKEDEWYIRVA
ncbi:hypothetical protein EW145_g1269 [Phellinidium pouzarii]|uniref:DUF6699 domain-containing protein n=1 Tax=Phellinidium pouzarii TaxID=167371 RepID=A0A4S4LF56_9AGAM|nr:hypothetical protein EW145_g1269 [Phellinidium pouzarii]